MLSRRALLASLCATPRLWPAATSAPIVLTARRNDFHQLLVPARIDGSPPLWCELDSGGGGALVFIEAAKANAIGIMPTSYGRSAGPLENALALDGRTRVTLAFQGLKLPEQELVIKPTPLLGDKDASIGMLVLSRYVVELDHDSPAVRLHDPDQFRYTGPGKAFPFTIEENNPYTTATLTLRDGKEVPARLVIDTGAAGSIAYLSRSFAAQHKLTEHSLASAPDSLGRRACRLERFAMGTLGVTRPVVHEFLEPGFGGKTEPDGMIGVEFLRRFKVFFDYGRSRMILEPNSRFAEPSRFDASGLRVHRVAGFADAVRIYQVLPGTPAADAGLQETDLIVAVDDTPVQRMSPGLVQETLMRDGRECRLLIQRGYDVFQADLKLKRLL
ncbi:MAG: hypothetical protein JWP63_5936 [Candidatus Solibacter sp.]|nr:hypothetical protein [Candidatus Solibacter sp.]